MRLLICALLLVGFAACKKESGASTAPLIVSVDTTAKSIATGIFQNGPYGTVSGKGQVLKNADGSYAILLDSFSTSNGPDLFVYLSKQPTPIDFIEAGKLKATNGRQLYELSGKPDLELYKYICIHCRAFNHLFGYAKLP